MYSDLNKLDNPVWYSLSEVHQKFSVGSHEIKFYHPDYCPFGGSIATKGTRKEIEEYSTLTDKFFIVGERPELPRHLQLGNELVCLQMVVDEKIDVEEREDIVPLTYGHTEALYQLVNLVQPGYFKIKTALLGNYFGIFRNGELVSVTGERMQMNHFVEVSAVVTHPNHTGQGYAKQLIAHSVNNIFSQNRMPYLHVVEDNIGAITLYKKLGFTTRRKISFWKVTK